MGRSAVGVRARAAAQRLNELRVEAKAVRAESRQRKRSAFGAAAEDELAAIVAELFDLDARFDAWDGIHPPPEALASRIFAIEGRLASLERRLRRLRPAPPRIEAD